MRARELGVRISLGSFSGVRIDAVISVLPVGSSQHSKDF